MQCAAVASQKFTCPTVRGVPPAVTVAVSVTTVPEDTVVTETPLLFVIAKVEFVVTAQADPA